MPITSQMFNPALVDPADRDTVYAEAQKAAVHSYAAYLALGAMCTPLSDEETDEWGGECCYIDWVLMHLPLIEIVVKTAYDNDIEFPGVFLYEVVEEFGAWLRTAEALMTIHEDAKAELARLAGEFFGNGAANPPSHYADIMLSALGQA